jgi:hypothetical protein
LGVGVVNKAGTAVVPPRPTIGLLTGRMIKSPETVVAEVAGFSATGNAWAVGAATAGLILAGSTAPGKD